MDHSLCQVVGVDLDDDSYFLNLVKMDMITGARLSWWVIGLAKYPPALTGSSISLASEQALALRRWKSLKILKPLHLCRVSQKNALSECCWSQSALTQSPFAGPPFFWRLIFWSFLTNTKQDPAPPSHVNGKIKPHSTQLLLLFDFVLLVHFLGHPVLS